MFLLKKALHVVYYWLHVAGVISFHVQLFQGLLTFPCQKWIVSQLKGKVNDWAEHRTCVGNQPHIMPYSTCWFDAGLFNERHWWVQALQSFHLWLFLIWPLKMCFFNLTVLLMAAPLWFSVLSILSIPQHTGNYKEQQSSDPRSWNAEILICRVHVMWQIHILNRVMSA